MWRRFREPAARAARRAIIVPITIALIFLLLYTAFNSLICALLKASANVLSGKQNAKVQLPPAGAALIGQSPIDLANDPKVIVNFAVGDVKPERARFTLGAKSDHKGPKH